MSSSRSGRWFVTGIVVSVSAQSGLPDGTTVRPLKTLLDTEPFIPSDVVDFCEVDRRVLRGRTRRSDYSDSAAEDARRTGRRSQDDERR
ncbi:MAG: hypothetical protein QM736_25570 [Vicinamibacterales bacterium]